MFVRYHPMCLPSAPDDNHVKGPRLGDGITCTSAIVYTEHNDDRPVTAYCTRYLDHLGNHQAAIHADPAKPGRIPVMAEWDDRAEVEYTVGDDPLPPELAALGGRP